MTWAVKVNKGDYIIKTGRIHKVKATHLTANGMVVLTLVDTETGAVSQTAPLPKMIDIKEEGENES